MRFPPAFDGVRPETPLHAARDEDHERIARMLATDRTRWSHEDINIVMSRAQTTIGGPETFKWVLPSFLIRSAAAPTYGWMTGPEVMADKLDNAGFDGWPADQRAATLEMLVEWLESDLIFGAEDPIGTADAQTPLWAWLRKRGGAVGPRGGV